MLVRSNGEAVHRRNHLSQLNLPQFVTSCISQTAEVVKRCTVRTSLGECRPSGDDFDVFLRLLMCLCHPRPPYAML